MLAGSWREAMNPSAANPIIIATDQEEDAECIPEQYSRFTGSSTTGGNAMQTAVGSSP